MRVLRELVAALPRGPMRDSIFLFPSTTGGMRSRSALDKPFRDVLKALGWTVRLTPRGMRRTFNRERSGVIRRPAGIVKSRTTAVKRAVIVSVACRNLEREKGFEPSTSTLAR